MVRYLPAHLAADYADDADSRRLIVNATAAC